MANARTITWAAAVLAACLPSPGGNPGRAGSDLRLVVANDNRTPAGRFRSDTLEIHLEVRMAVWRPEADSGPSIEVAAFGEEGRAPTIPGPLIRVRTGTIVVASVTNALSDSTISVHGLVTHPGTWGDSLILHPGDSRTVRFTAGAPGTYFYLAVLGRHTFDNDIDDEREQVSGAFIVDPPNVTSPDRILMINIWGSTIDSTHYRNTLTINGRAWPYTERMLAMVGDSVHWRVINASGRNHPMHLHGFFYLVDARGDGVSDTLYSPSDRQLVVTEGLLPLTTMAMTYVPDRAGNWLFHCHIGFHVVPDARLDPPPPESHDRMAHDPTVHMAGLVVGITVRPRPNAIATKRGQPRQLHLFVQEGAKRNRARRAMGFVLQRGPMPPAPDSTEIPGSLLVLTRGEPTDLVVTNRLREPTAIHWHGIELESYSDGVAGWSGAGTQLAPSIEPSDSFTAQLTLPRAGTFIYHTHMNDIEQLTSGLYGGIVVLEPGRRFDPATDHVFIIGWDGDADPPHILVNGDSAPPPLEVTAGVSQRFRLVNIGPAGRFLFSIYRDSSPATWRHLAKDGADLPPRQARSSAAGQVVQVGETYDFEVIPERGEYRLVLGAPKTPLWVQRLVVRH
jgi:FtsP/CotA-like multicopper oxidase with cupredoxin domain